MAVYLGNLSIQDMESRTGVQFPQELHDFMNERHQSNAQSVQPGEWHCFDIPFMLVCGDEDTASAIYKHLQPLASQFNAPLQIGIHG